jgi:uncharacterized glyoxalase superfamily protein PhnB
MANAPFDADALAARPAVIPSVSYLDPKRMYRWLEDAFGFEPLGIILDGDGNVMHAEMGFGGGVIMVGTEWPGLTKSPASVGGANTQRVHIRLDSDLDAHCERARAAGAEIVDEPAVQFYGDKTYRARDPDGHNWTFAQSVKEVTAAEWDASMGVKTYTRQPE